MRASLRGRRFEVLDSWRGIAALLVALFHFPGLYHAYGLPLIRNSYLFVDFFFVLSGFVITHAYWDRLASKDEVSAFVIRRFGRVWPLHIAVLLAFIAIELLKWVLTAVAGLKSNFAAFDPAGATPLSTLPAHFTLTQALGFQSGLTWNHPSWSISAEFWTYIVFAAIMAAAPRRFRLPVLGLMSVISAALLMRFARHGMDATYDFGLLRCLYGFGVGAMIYKLRCQVPLLPWPAGVLEGLAVAGVAAFVWLAGYGEASFAAPIIFAACVFVFSFEAGPISGVLRQPFARTLGTRSYSIYMVHVLIVTVLTLTISVLQKPLFGREVYVAGANGIRIISGIDPFVMDAGVIAYLFVVVALAGLTFKYIEEPGRVAFGELADRAFKVRGGKAHHV